MSFTTEVEELYAVQRKQQNPLLLDQLVRSYKYEKVPSESLIRQTKNNATIIRQTLSVVDANVKNGQAQNAKVKLLRHFFDAPFNITYDTISPEMFDLKRIVQRSGYDITIPVFATTPYGYDVDWQYRVDEGHKRIEIISRAPSCPQGVHDAARVARATWAESYAKCARISVVGDIINREPHLVGGLRLNIYWIPKPEDLQISVREIDPDPILVGTMHNKHYLIAQWNLGGEEPFEHYLARYSNERI